eukprot:scaffold50862_cov65-Phaeocystis_antarctica.AAC.4
MPYLRNVGPYGLVSARAAHQRVGRNLAALIKGRRRLVGVGRKGLVAQQRHCEDLCDLEAKLFVGHVRWCSGSPHWGRHQHAVPARLRSLELSLAAGRLLNGAEQLGLRRGGHCLNDLVHVRAEREARHAVVLQGLREEIRAQVVRAVVPHGRLIPGSIDR